jgi:type I restriction enzyme M protein
VKALSSMASVNFRLGLDDVGPDILGQTYEYLLRKFAEGSAQSVGEFFTPREVGVLTTCCAPQQESRAA